MAEAIWNFGRASGAAWFTQVLWGGAGQWQLGFENREAEIQTNIHLKLFEVSDILATKPLFAL